MCQVKYLLIQPEDAEKPLSLSRWKTPTYKHLDTSYPGQLESGTRCSTSQWDWFWSPYCALRWAWLFPKVTINLHKLRFLPCRRGDAPCSKRQFWVQKGHTSVPRCPMLAIQNVLHLTCMDASFRWWTHRRANPCGAFRLNSARLHWQRPSCRPWPLVYTQTGEGSVGANSCKDFKSSILR